MVAELLKPLSDKKAPDRARLAALAVLAQLAEAREGGVGEVGEVGEVGGVWASRKQNINYLERESFWSC